MSGQVSDRFSAGNNDPHPLNAVDDEVRLLSTVIVKKGKMLRGGKTGSNVDSIQEPDYLHRWSSCIPSQTV